MRKIIIYILAFICLACLSACGNTKTTELSVTLNSAADISESENTPELPDGTDEVSGFELNTPEVISLSPDFTAEQTRNMSNFSNGGFYYADEMLYGRLCPISGNYLRMSAVAIDDGGEFVHSGTPFFIDDDVSPSYMCCSGDTMYYVRELNSTGALSIAGVNKDGGAPEILYEGTRCNYLQLHGGRLYFTDEAHNFVSTDMNGGDMQIIIGKEVYLPYFIDEEWVLFQDDADNESLHLFNISSYYDIKLNDMRSYTPVIAGSDLFYLGIPDGEENRRLCHMDLSNIALKAEAGTTEYLLDREVEVSDRDVYTLFTDGEYIYGANNTVSPISEWQNFSDEGYSHLSENCRYLHEGWSIGYQLNDNGAVKNIILRNLTTSSVSILPRVYG